MQNLRSAILFLTFVTGVSFIHASTLPVDTSKTALKNINFDCPNKAAVDTIIEEAISVGAPTYNDGNHIGCYRVYEGASYKILYKYGALCNEVSDILKTALRKSYEAYTISEKAWIIRAAFDKILGVPTRTK
jgi:hypothetical protein